MPTSARRAFRPALMRLEEKALLSQLSTLPNPPTADITVPAPGTGNSYLDASSWMGLHDEYTMRARRGGNAVVFLGDSMIYLWGDPKRKPRPDQLGPIGTASWNTVVAPYHAANFGIIGDDSADLLWRIQHGELAGRPRVAVVLIGVNDLVEGHTPEETASGILADVQAIRTASPNTRILLLGLLPPVSDPANPYRIAVDRVDSLLRQSSAGIVTYLDTSSAFLQPDGTLIPGLIQTTSFHPTEEGYQVLSQAIQGPLKSLLNTRVKIQAMRQPRPVR
jgi:lysophospholipase L1-like esterase